MQLLGIAFLHNPHAGHGATKTMNRIDLGDDGAKAIGETLPKVPAVERMAL